MEKGKALEQLITLRIIQEDAETIYSLIQTERDPVFSAEILPYYALFVKSCQEYLNEDFLPSEISLKITDIRNYIKAFSRGFGKTQKEIAAVDASQNESFKRQLTFPFMQNWNIHQNLGIFWTSDRHMVGNSQQCADFLNIEDFFAPEVGKVQQELGEQIRLFVASVRSGVASVMTPPIVERAEYNIKIPYFYDINTNKNKKNVLFANNWDKELNLFYLNLLCNLNFVKYVLRPLLCDENSWALRVEYAVNYYTYRALVRLKNYCENNNRNMDLSPLINLIDITNDVFDSKLRGCMMHYGLEGQGIISPEYITYPFFGVFESCLGIEFYSYLNSLRSVSDAMIAFLESNFNFSDIKLERF